MLNTITTSRRGFMQLSATSGGAWNLGARGRRPHRLQ